MIKDYTIQPGDTLIRIFNNNKDLGYSSWQELRDANINEIKVAGARKMAAIGIGPNVTRLNHCEIDDPENYHKNSPFHFIKNGIHYDRKDDPDSPTIYPGTKLHLIGKDEQPKEEEPKKEDPPDPQIIKKSQWTGVEHQSPVPKLEIFTKNDPDHADFTYGAGEKYTKLLGYNFTESVDDLDGSFSFTVENEEIDADGRTVFDYTPLRSVVKIYEGGEPPRFVGIIRSRNLSKQMTGQGMKRTITFSGKSIISCISEYQVSLDVRISNVFVAADSLNVELTDYLLKAENIAQFISITWNYFLKISDTLNENRKNNAETADKEGQAGVGFVTTKIGQIIDKYIGETERPKNGEMPALLPFVNAAGDTTIKYKLGSTFMNQSNNHVADCWRNILPERAYELYGYCDKEGNPKIMARLMPFGSEEDASDWKNLDMYLISPVSLTAFDMRQNDEEVYTAFSAYIIGSSRDRQFSMAANRDDKDSLIEYADDKIPIYGFRPLEIDFKGYARGDGINTEEGDIKATQSLNRLARYWYGRNDDMYSGTITIITDFIEHWTNPRIGCRAKFLDGEFYINKTDHSWQYGGTPTIKISVSRGMIYNENGVMRDGANGIMKDIGKQYKELDMEGVQ